MVSDCGSHHLFGGLNIFSGQTTAWKSLNNLIPHYKLKLSVKILKMDSWGGSTVTFYLQLAYIIPICQFKFKHIDTQTDLCGTTTGEYLSGFSFEFDHYTSDLTFGFEDQSNSDEYYGIFDIRIESLLCDHSCLQCFGPNNNQCSQCYPNAHPNALFECVCMSQYYFVADVRECLPCNSICNECTGANDLDCVSCAITAKSYQNKCFSSCPLTTWISAMNLSLCVDSCNADEYEEVETKSCKLCHSSCFTCKGTSVSDCLNCPSLSFFYKNSCYLICPLPLWGNSFNYLCEASCDVDQYGDQVDRVCKECDVSCSSCSNSGPSNCLNCFGNLFLFNGICLSQCPSTYWNLNQTCVSDCGIGKFGDIYNRRCKNCDSKCESCISNSSLDCISCYSGFFLENGQCVRSCKSGFYGNFLNRICQSCEPSCSICKESTSHDCLSCVDSKKYLENFGCVVNCSENLFERDDIKTCEKCNPKNCLECNVKWNKCQKCEENYTLYMNSSCLKNIFINPTIIKIGENNVFKIMFNKALNFSINDLAKFISLNVDNSNIGPDKYKFALDKYNDSEFSLSFSFLSNITTETKFSLEFNQAVLRSYYPNYLLNQTILENNLSSTLVCPKEYMPQSIITNYFFQLFNLIYFYRTKFFLSFQRNFGSNIIFNF